ncbi:MAG: chloride channel protein [Deltaproteobacteria bacterium]|nr:chloride channel protein [Deltaproteobacteria bacterium]
MAGKWLILGSLVGVVAGLGAIAFQALLQIASGALLENLAGLGLGRPGGEPPVVAFTTGPFRPWLVVLLPALGGLVSGLIVRWFAPEAGGHGTDAAIRAYHHELGRIHWRVPLVKLVASVLTLGSGGSGGREGPIAQIGAGFGSFVATRLGLSTRTRRWLLAAGIGAGVGSIFRAPLAGAVFAAEVLYASTEVETEVLLPATVASIVAYSVFAARFGWGHMFTGVGDYDFSRPIELVPYLVLALIVAAAAWVFVRTFYGVRNRVARLRLAQPLKTTLGGLATGLVALGLYYAMGRDAGVFDVLSAGYGIVQETLESDGTSVGLALLLVVAAGKIVTTTFSIGSGGSAGVFGPSMVIGATLGAAVGKVFHGIAPDMVPHVAPFAIVGMAGFFAAAANTPISTVIMVSELTGNYKLLVPAMWVCALAFLAGGRWSIFHNQVQSRVASPVHFGEQARHMFSTTTVGEIVKKDRRFALLTPSMTLGEALAATGGTRQRLFPVVEGSRLVGTFHQDDLLGALQDSRPGAAPLRVSDLVAPRPPIVRFHDSVSVAQRLLRTHHVDEILVVDAHRTPVGILTNADILLAFTRTLSQRQATEGEVFPDTGTETEDTRDGAEPRT